MLLSIDSFSSPAKMPMKNTQAMPKEMPLTFILPKARPMAMMSETITTVCIDEWVVNREDR